VLVKTKGSDCNAIPFEEAACVSLRQASRNRKAMGEEIRQQDSPKEKEQGLVRVLFGV